MGTEIDKINHKLDKLSDDLHRIMRYLYNDNETNTKGLIQQVAEIKSDVSFIQETNKIAMAKKSVWIIVLSSIGTGLMLLIKFLITKSI